MSLALWHCSSDSPFLFRVRDRGKDVAAMATAGAAVGGLLYADRHALDARAWRRLSVDTEVPASSVPVLLA
jgi:hypothetical protein